VIEAATPLISVVIVTYNNYGFTRACLHSVLALSDYPRLEVIVVDNASSDETPAQLRRIRDPRVRVILNEENLGFAAGNNVGLRAAKGDYVVMLNNDTYVTRGWLRDLIRPLMLDETVGLVGPLTNNIGNEQKLLIHYSDMGEMASAARARIRSMTRHVHPTSGLAFFCVALRRRTLDEVGYLHEAYGQGFFEDDDYCRRVEAAGLRLVIADDAFVHHHLSASFNALGDERKQRLMVRNKAIYEELWGEWKPHAYRAAPGFG
jgi:GT2 family glycosyltransferase